MKMSGFIGWLAGVVIACWMMTSDFRAIQMVGLALVFTTCGGLLGWVHGYSERDLEARREVLLRENSMGRN